MDSFKFCCPLRWSTACAARGLHCDTRLSFFKFAPRSLVSSLEFFVVQCVSIYSWHRSLFHFSPVLRPGGTVVRFSAYDVVQRHARLQVEPVLQTHSCSSNPCNDLYTEPDVTFCGFLRPQNFVSSIFLALLSGIKLVASCCGIIRGNFSPSLFFPSAEAAWLGGCRQ